MLNLNGHFSINILQDRCFFVSVSKGDTPYQEHQHNSLKVHNKDKARLNMRHSFNTTKQDKICY